MDWEKKGRGIKVPQKRGQMKEEGLLGTRPYFPQAQEGSAPKSHPDVDRENARKPGERDRPSRQLAMLFWVGC